MAQVAQIVKSVKDYTSVNLELEIKEWLAQNELSFGKVMGPLRLLLVGDLKGPHLFDIMEMLGREEASQRIARGLSELS